MYSLSCHQPCMITQLHAIIYYDNNNYFCRNLHLISCRQVHFPARTLVITGVSTAATKIAIAPIIAPIIVPNSALPVRPPVLHQI